MKPSCLHLPWNEQTQAHATQLLREGAVVAVPTETVYGLAGISWKSDAVLRIFSAKQRPSFDPLIAHVPASWSTLELLQKHEVIQLELCSQAWRKTMELLIQKFWPGPLTLLMPRHPRICELACSGLPDVAVRMPAHPIFQALLESLQCPLSAPSANRFGRISPTSAQDVIDELGDEIPLVIEGGRAQFGLESTILHVDQQGQALCLRLGACSLEDIEQVLGYRPQLVAKEHPTLAPGMLERHYAPGKSLWLLNAQEDPRPQLRTHAPDAKRVALLFCSAAQPGWSKDLQATYQTKVFTLSPEHDDREAAQALFTTLRTIDQGDFDLILAEAPPSSFGLWPAIRDRLQRAALKKLTEPSLTVILPNS